MSVHKTGKLPMGQGLKQMWSEGGIRGLWRGNFVNVLKVTPESAVKFMTFEFMKSLFRDENSEIPAHLLFLAGSCSGSNVMACISTCAVVNFFTQWLRTCLSFPWR